MPTKSACSLSFARLSVSFSPLTLLAFPLARWFYVSILTFSILSYRFYSPLPAFSPPRWLEVRLQQYVDSIPDSSLSCEPLARDSTAAGGERHGVCPWRKLSDKTVNPSETPPALMAEPAACRETYRSV